MGLRGQVDGEAVLAGVGQLGQGALMVAGHEQVVQVLADHLGGLHVAQRFRRVAGTAEVHQQGGLGAGEEVLRRGHQIGGRIGLDLEVVLGVQRLIQGVADKFAGAGAGQHDVKVLRLDHLVKEGLQLLLAGGDLRAGLAPGGGLLIDLVHGKGGRSLFHLLLGQVENAHTDSTS